MATARLTAPNTARATARSTAQTADSRGLLRRLGDGLLALTEANPRLREAQRLQGMSDADLAARGLKREDIARHVYRDMFYV